MTMTLSRRQRLGVIALLLIAALCGSETQAFSTPIRKSPLPKQQQLAFQSRSCWKIRNESPLALNAFADAAAVSQGQLPALAAGAAVLVALVALVAGAVLTKKDGGIADVISVPLPEPEPEPPVDLSIPYDAAARLAYDQWRVDHGREEFVEEEYQKFKALYEEKTVADVIAKKVARELEKL